MGSAIAPPSRPMALGIEIGSHGQMRALLTAITLALDSAVVHAEDFTLLPKLSWSNHWSAAWFWPIVGPFPEALKTARSSTPTLKSFRRACGKRVGFGLLRRHGRGKRAMLFRGRHFRAEIIVLCLRSIFGPVSALSADLSQSARNDGRARNWSPITRPSGARSFGVRASSTSESVRKGKGRADRGPWMRRMFAWRNNGPICTALHGALDSAGNTIDSLQSPHRDLIATKRFLQGCVVARRAGHFHAPR